jgi:hypothetical protein
MQIVQRLTLECGHMRLSGPWDSLLDDDGTPRHMIGDVTWCEICPRVRRAPGSGTGKEMRMGYVVHVEDVPPSAFREPKRVLKEERRRQMYG